MNCHEAVWRRNEFLLSSRWIHLSPFLFCQLWISNNWISSWPNHTWFSSSDEARLSIITNHVTLHFHQRHKKKEQPKELWQTDIYYLFIIIISIIIVIGIIIIIIGTFFTETKCFQVRFLFVHAGYYLKIRCERTCPYLYFLLCVLQSRGMDLVEILSFLFQLSFSTLGRVSAQRFAPLWFCMRA